jgi:hypothetical protein
MKPFSAALVASAIAAPTAAASNFTDRTDFQNAADAAGIPLLTESWESFTPDSATAQRDQVANDNFILTAVNESFTFIPPLSILDDPTIPNAPDGDGTMPTDGEQYLHAASLYSSNDNNDIVLTFAFNEPQSAFFLDLTDLNGLDQAPNPRAILSSNAGDSLTIFEGDGADLFTVGFISDTTFTEVTLRATAGDSFGVDAVSYGVPTPASASLLALSAAAAARRRR